MGGINIPQIFDEAIASNGFIYTNAQLLQALDKKAGRTTQYHPGFSITSAQLLRAIDELEVGEPNYYTTDSSDTVTTNKNSIMFYSNGSSISSLTSNIDPTKITHLFLINCPNIRELTNIDSMTNLRVIDLSGITRRRKLIL